MDEKPRMTAEEADARFAALVAEHRATRPERKRGPQVARGPRTARMGASLRSNLAIAAVFVIGVVAGASWHTKALGVAIVGVPLVLAVRALLVRRTAPRDDGSAAS